MNVRQLKWVLNSLSDDLDVVIKTPSSQSTEIDGISFNVESNGGTVVIIAKNEEG